MLGQSIYIKSRRSGQLTLVWEMGGDRRGGSWERVCWVTEGKGKGKWCVFQLGRDRKRMFVSVYISVCLCFIYL